MSRVAWPILVLVCLVPNLGCLTPLRDTVGGGSADSSAAAREKKPELPPASSAKVNLNLAEVMEKNGHLSEAIFHYERARQSDPSLRIATRLARLYDRGGDQAHALAEYQRALHENPKDAEVRASFGYFYYSHGKWTEAEEQLRQALAINPKHKRAWVNLGMTLGAKGHYLESLDAFRNGVSEAEAHSNLAFILTTQGKRTEAKNEYRRALELAPNLTIARRALEKLENPAAPPGEAHEGAWGAASEKAERHLTRPTGENAAQPVTPSRSPAALPDQSPIVVQIPSSRESGTESEASQAPPKRAPLETTDP